MYILLPVTFCPDPRTLAWETPVVLNLLFHLLPGKLCLDLSFWLTVPMCCRLCLKPYAGSQGPVRGQTSTSTGLESDVTRCLWVRLTVILAASFLLSRPKISILGKKCPGKLSPASLPTLPNSGTPSTPLSGAQSSGQTHLAAESFVSGRYQTYSEAADVADTSRWTDTKSLT